MNDELSTDAFAFLNVNHPLCAWDTYRSVLVCAEDNTGYVSVWSAQTLRHNQPDRIVRELFLERVRKAHFEERISRLRGMFCFLDISSAERACNWATNSRSHFRPEYLAELHLKSATSRRDRLDANWIAYQPAQDEDGHLDGSWAYKYWAGDPCPGHEPIWETLVDGRAIVLGTKLRERAYEIIKKAFPDSLMFLEIGRMAAVVGSDLGNVFAVLQEVGSDLILGYQQDMRDADDPDFIRRLEELKASGHPINWADMAPHIANDSFGKVMDLRPFGFRRPKVEMPYTG
jgi:hypothetical protein